MTEKFFLEAMWGWMESRPDCPECGGLGGAHTVVTKEGRLCSHLFSGPMSTQEHDTFSMHCWCHPQLVDGVIVHNYGLH